MYGVCVTGVVMQVCVVYEVYCAGVECGYVGIMCICWHCVWSVFCGCGDM